MITNLGNLFQRLSLVTLIVALWVPGLACAQGKFEQGKTRVSVGMGAGRTLNNSHFLLELGAGYYILDGLELGLDARSWMGGEFNVHELAPSLTYVFSNLGGFVPYGGVLYRHTFVEGRDSLSAYGARAGIYLEQSQNLVLRAGLAAIRYRNCEDTFQRDCTEYYPEIAAGFYF